MALLKTVKELVLDDADILAVVVEWELADSIAMHLYSNAGTVKEHFECSVALLAYFEYVKEKKNTIEKNVE